MYQKKKSAYTVLELVFAISIGIILSTIAFLNYTSYNKSARDSSRLNDLTLINKWISLFYSEKNLYPQPSDGVNVTFSGANVWTQGTVWDSVIRNLGTLTRKPVDPLTNIDYTYSLSSKGNEFQIASALEKEKNALANGVIQQSYADGTIDGYARILGNYNGVILFTSTWGVDYGLAIPSLIASDLSNKDITYLVNNKKLVYNSFWNVPSNLSSSFKQWGFNYSPLEMVVWTGSLDELRVGKWYKVLTQKLQTIYENSILKNFGAYKDLQTNTEKYLNKTGNKKFTIYKDCTALVVTWKVSHDGMYTLKPSDGTYTDTYCDTEKGIGNPYPTANLSIDFTQNAWWVNGISTPLSNIFSITRSGNATYVDDDESVKAFGPNTLRYWKKWLLVEESRTNYITYSQNLVTNWFNGTFGSPTFTDFTVTPNFGEVKAPDGTLTATRLERSRSHTNDGMYYAQNINMLANTTYTFSMWARTTKNTSLQTKWWICCGWGLNEQPQITLDVNWKRFTVTWSVLADTSNGFRVITHENTQDQDVDILVWWVQVEAGNFASSYIPTTSTPITRPRDIISIWGSDFTNWYTSNKGTLYFDATTPSNKASRTFVSIDTNSADNNFAFRAISRNSNIELGSHNVGSGGNQYIENINPGSSTSLWSHKIAMGFENNNFAGSINGSTPVTDTNWVLSTANRLDIGAIGNTYFMDQMYIKRLSFWQSRKTNEELQTLSSNP